MDPVESVLHDAAALCQFVDRVAQRCVISASPSYTPASKEFLDYLIALADATRKHLASYASGLNPQAAAADLEGFYTDAQQIQTIRYIWFRLHGYVQPALDADTLQIPHTLVSVMTDRLRSLSGFQDARFAVLHTSELNYYQVSTGYIQDLASQIAKSIPGSPPFPPDLGLIVIPYSQSSALLLNTALAHEMGHFSFDKRAEKPRLAPSVIRELLAHPNIQTLLAKGSLRTQLCIDRCIRWLTEIYCDLFALSLVGPCFSLGFVELFALCRMSRNASPSVGQSAIYALLDFSDTHPAESVRLREQVAFLRRGSGEWWGEIEKSTSAHVQLLRDASAITDNLFTLSPQADNDLNKIALDVFLKVLPEVHPLVEATLSGVSNDASLFKSQSDDIQEYLSFGVVPSHIVKGASFYAPSTLALLNAASLFYLDHFDDLLSRVAAARKWCPECRALWADRIEMWTTKALEDVAP